MLRLAAPWMLAVGLPLVALVAIRIRKLPGGQAGPRRRLTQFLLLAGALCAALALARLELGRRIDRLAVIYVLDRSRSVERADEAGASRALDRIRASLEPMGQDDLAGLVVFGAEAATEVAPSPRPELGVAQAVVARDATDIASGIRRALADLPGEHAARIVLVSDGVETRGDALAAAALAAGRGVPIDVLPIERAPAPEILIERVRMPAVADPDQPVELRIVTRATRGARARVRVRRDGEVIAETETEIAEGNDVLVLRERAPRAGVHRYDVEIEPLEAGVDAAPENNEGGTFLRVTGGSRALVLAERPAEARALHDALARAGLEATLGGPASVPASLADMAAFDLIVLGDLNARSLTGTQLDELASYVRDLGGGLLMAGARESFGLGGWAGTPVEEVLPATFDLRRRRDRPSLAMVIAIDKSGSMMVEAVPGTTKLALANEAAARSALLLSPLDRVGVMHVDTEVGWTLPMTPVDDPRRIAAAVRAAEPGGGGIYVDVALRASFDALRDQSSQLKHLLLFSDGSDSEEMTQARSLVQQAARERITTSIVSMGVGPDTPELEQLSRIGGGRFYIVEDMTQLPRIFTQETIAASRAALRAEAFRAIPGEAGAPTEHLDFDRAPALGGYAVVNARPRATRLLMASREDPLLLTWQSGVGRGGVFATDAGSGFGRSWLGWEGYAVLFGQLGRDLARAAERRDARVDVSIRGGTGLVRVEAIDAEGRYQNHLDLSATIAGPQGRSIRVALAQTGAGRYEGTFDAGAPGPYLATVGDAGGGLVGSAGIVRARGDELRGEGTDEARLGRIAAQSGGRVLHDLQDVFTDRPPPIHAFAPLWRELILAAMLALFASVASRRLELPRWRKRKPPTPAAAPAASEIANTSDAAPGAPFGTAESAETSAPGPAEPSAAEPSAGPSGTAEPEPPATLAETLLAKKKRKR